MTFTGNLIESLMATVERVERRAEASAEFSSQALCAAEALSADGMLDASMSDASMLDASQAWFASVQERTDYDPKQLHLGVA